MKPMWLELEIVNRLSQEEMSRFMPLHSQKLDVGRSLGNGLLLLHPTVPPKAGSIERKGLRVRWIPHSNGKPVNLRKEWLSLGPYLLRVRCPWMVPLVSWIISCGLVLMWVAHTPHRLDPSQKVEERSISSLVHSLPARDSYTRVSAWPRDKAFQMEFSWKQSQANPIVLHLTPGGVSQPEQVRLLVNGHPHSFLGQTPSRRWGREERHQIPVRLLQTGINRIVLADQGLKANEFSWGVRNLYLTQTHSNGEYEESPERLYEAAQRIFSHRTFRPGEIVRARQHVDRAVALWKARGLSPKEEVRSFQHMIRIEENVMVDRMLSEARAASSLGKSKHAKQIYQKLLLELIEPTDSRRTEVQEALDKLEE